MTTVKPDLTLLVSLTLSPLPAIPPALRAGHPFLLDCHKARFQFLPRSTVLHEEQIRAVCGFHGRQVSRLNIERNRSQSSTHPDNGLRDLKVNTVSSRDRSSGTPRSEPFIISSYLVQSQHDHNGGRGREILPLEFHARPGSQSSIQGT